MKSISNSTERGQALIVIALAAVALFGFVALAIDGSAKFADRRNSQNAADTAALAAALAKVNALTDGDSNTPAQCPPSSGLMSDASDVCVTMVLAGLDRADSNGYDTSNSTVQIYSPPLNGYYSTVSNSDDFVQVIITSHVKTSFMRVLGVSQSDNVVSAVAYLREGGNLTDGAMIISYDPDPNCSSGAGSGGGSVDVSGSGVVNLTGGGIFMNSDEVCGFSIPNCADLNISSGAGINSAGSTDNIDQSGCADPASENLDQEQVAIPDDVYWPDVPTACSTAPATPVKLGKDPSDNKDEWLIYPGFYTDFPQASLIPNNKHIYMASGVYCIDPPGTQNLQWSGSSFLNLNGSTDASKNKYHAYNPYGVTLYIKSGGGFSLSINSPIHLDASTDGDLQGYLLVLEGNQSSIKSCTINGGSYLDINGLIWAPYCDITINGGSDSQAEINAQVVGWDLKINGNNTINFNYDPSNQVILKRRLGLMK
jgi:Flp pilus assembly protein TadG